MYCPRCRRKMREQKRTSHKMRKWVCPFCRKVRMERPKTRRGPRRPGASAGEWVT